MPGSWLVIKPEGLRQSVLPDGGDGVFGLTDIIE
jgi:hypothetical protein